MKKSYLILLSSLLISVGATAETSDIPKKSKAFVGLEFFSGDSTLESELSGGLSGTTETDFDPSGFKIKFGKDQKNDFRFQAYVFSEDADDAFENNIYGFGADVLKSFPINSTVSPYLLLGGVVGSTKLEDSSVIDYVDDRLNMVGVKAGIGGLFRLQESIEITLGFDMSYRKWQEIKFITGGPTVTLEQNDTSKVFYAGFNYHF